MVFIGSTAELTVTLDGLRRYVETARVPIRDGRDASAVVRRYFSKSPRGMVVWAEQRVNDIGLDFVLHFGEQRVAVEVKLLQRVAEAGEPAIRDVAESFAGTIRRAEFTRGALVVFSRAQPPEAYRTARVVEDGDVSIVVIHSPD